MAQIMIEWHAMHDDKACLICKLLDNYVWVFDTKDNPLDASLTHPQFGVVWDMHGGSMAHGHEDMGSCRCNMTWEIDFSDTKKMIAELREQMVEGLRGIK